MSNAVLERSLLGVQLEHQTPIESVSLSTRAEGYFERLGITRTDTVLMPGPFRPPSGTASPAWWQTPVTLKLGVALTQPTSITQIPRAFLEMFDSGFLTLSRVEAPEAMPAEDAVDPVAAADDLRAWLRLTWDELQQITGIATNTFHDWRRTNRNQRPSKVRKLMRVHALARAMRARLGPQGAAEWFRTGSQNPVDLLLAGNLDVVEEAASILLFRRDKITRDDRYNYAPFAPEPDYDADVESRTIPPRRMQRGPRRGRLPRS